MMSVGRLWSSMEKKHRKAKATRSQNPFIPTPKSYQYGETIRDRGQRPLSSAVRRLSLPIVRERHRLSSDAFDLDFDQKIGVQRMLQRANVAAIFSGKDGNRF